jgi:polyhydroxyalkanoate synthesis repressor PhaR
MAKEKEPTTIKKYANRRLYNTGTSTYVTLEDLAEMVKAGEDFVVFDAKSGEEITRSVLTQIIFEQENKGQNLLPITFLRQLIRFYGDSIQNLVPTYLDFSIDSLVREQEKFRNQMTSAFAPGAFTPAGFDAIGDHVRRNTEMFEQAMRMFLPFSPGRDKADAPAKPAAAEPTAARANGDLEALKRQLDEVQKRLDKLSSNKGD